MNKVKISEIKKCKYCDRRTRFRIKGKAICIDCQKSEGKAICIN